MQNDIKIKIYGKGGQGVKFLATTLGKIFASSKYEHITVSADYDTVVRGGKISADLVASHEPNKSPIVEYSDITILLSPIKPDKRSDYLLSFTDSSDIENLETYANTIFTLEINPSANERNLFVLGATIKLLNNINKFTIDQTELVDTLQKVLPTNRKEENIKSAILGYEQKY
ncbi:MAG TPA: hypothetical protein PLX79_03370 [Candidatus Dojkabacteria bacterium]|nr:hypothetical protein [Bacilli bacterium]HQG57987.1 hypothetical protein [Candidatus Dojkabacteria bacterium]